MRPYAYKTTDFGRTWTSVLSEVNPLRGYAHVVKEDLVNEDLLFVGTELGLWASLDGGQQWAQYKGGDFPNVAVCDLAIHPRDHDLVIATHGRGIWIIDDITPLRALTPEALAQEAMFIEAKPPVQRIPASGGWVNGDASFLAPNPSDDATITYYQKKRHIFGDLKIEIFDENGKSMGTLPSSKRRGLSRMTWGMRLKAPKVPPAATAASPSVGPRVLPGTYNVKMTKDKKVYTTKFTVGLDPRSRHTLEDRKAQFDLSMKLYNMLGDMTFVVDRINNVRSALDDRASKLAAGELGQRLRTASIRADEFRKMIVATKEGGMITGEERLREFLSDLYQAVTGYEGKPTQAQIERTGTLARELDDVARDFDAWAARELADVNTGLAEKKLEPITPLTRGEWEKRDTQK